MAPPRVLIIGCGVAGPVLALLLKQKGYSPIILEKVRSLGDVGASLMMMPNGLKVLSLLNLDFTVTGSAPNIKFLEDRKYNGSSIGGADFPSTWKEKYTQPACGVKRTNLNLALKEAVLKAGIEIKEGWKLESIGEVPRNDNETGVVVAIAEDGRREEGEFLVGCDGIKSAVRSLVLFSHGLPEGEVEFTGLTQTSGIAPTPESLKTNPTMLNIYGPDAHVICYPVSPTHTSFAITQRSPLSSPETWQSMTAEKLATYREELLTLFTDWTDPVPQLIQSAEKFIKFGLYDRPHLSPSHWYSTGSRCILIGDAAHPTSPHLGQGANQALEDCYHLSRLLPDLTPSSPSLNNSISVDKLKDIFSEHASKRQPRTSMLVRGARAQGENRVVGGGMEGGKRDEDLGAGWADLGALERKWEGLFREPF